MKKLENKRIAGWVIGAGCLAVLSACTYRGTDEDWDKNGKVCLYLNWQTAGRPSAMAYYFYKDGIGRPVIRSGDASGYEGTLPAGHYKVAVCNTDCSNILLEMESGYEQALGKVKQVSVLKSSAVCIAQPANLYGSSCEEVEIGGEQTVVKELYPASLIKTLELNIKVTGSGKGEIGLSELSGRLTGVSSQVHVPSGEPLFDTPAFLDFSPEPVVDGVYTASLNLFGLSPGEEDNEPVDLYLTLKVEDGKEITSFADITGEVGDAFAKTVSAHVILDLTLDYDEVNGLSMVLTGWKEGSGEA